MLQGFLSVLVVCFSLISAAQSLPVTREMIAAKSEASGFSSDEQTMDVTLTLGIGYHLCPTSTKLPPLDTAYMCSGFAPFLENFVFTLKPVKTAKPEWKMWSATTTQSLGPAFGVLMSYELSVSFAKVDGTNYVFIDGRIMNDKATTPTYFRITSYNDFSQLDSTYNYGVPLEIKLSGGGTGLLSPIVVVSKYLPEAGKPRKP